MINKLPTSTDNIKNKTELPNYMYSYIAPLSAGNHFYGLGIAGGMHKDLRPRDWQVVEGRLTIYYHWPGMAFRKLRFLICIVAAADVIDPLILHLLQAIEERRHNARERLADIQTHHRREGYCLTATKLLL